MEKIKTMTNSFVLKKTKPIAMKKESKTFKIYDIPYIFIFGGLIGNIYEVLVTFFSTGLIENHAGSILTPFNYVYGLGAVLMFILLHKIKNRLLIFSLGSLLGGIVEFGLSFGQELFLGSTSWNYTGKFLNIGGRTTVPYMLVWGGLCLLCTQLIFPILLSITHKIPERTRKKIAIAIICIMSVDALVTSSAVIRYAQRENGVVAENIILQLVDKTYNNQFMSAHFPNMIFK